MITYQIEAVHPFAEEARELFLQHYEEIADQALELNYDLSHYERAQSAGALVIHTIRDDGALGGYHIWLVARHPRYQGTLCASSDLLYVKKEWRRGFEGYRFLKWSIEELRLLGVGRIIFHVKPHLDYSPLLTRLRAKKFETSYALNLGD